MPDGFSALGLEFLVNTFTANIQNKSRVIGLNDGGYLIIWESFAGDVSVAGVFGQNYNSAGEAVGSEYRVNTETHLSQYQPSISSLLDGGFFVTWTSNGQDGDLLGVFGQRFDASGAMVGVEFQINTENFSNQSAPSVTVLSDDRSVVIWESFQQDGSIRGV